MDTDWLSVLGNSIGTLLATIIGAIVALIGARTLHERESKDRYEDSLDEGIAMLVEEVSVHRRAASDWRQRNSLNRWRLRAASRSAVIDMPDPAPSLARFLALVDIVTLRAKGEDRAVLHSAAFAAEDLIPDTHDEQSAERAYDLAQILLTWRVVDMGTPEVLRELDAMMSTWADEDEEAHAARLRERDSSDEGEQ